MPTTPLAACSERTYISPDTEPRPTMDQIGESEVRMHLPRALDSVPRGETLTITRHGKPIARPVPIPHDRDRARKAAARILKRREHLARVPLEDLMATIREGHFY